MQRANAAFNRLVVPALRAPVLGALLRRHLVELEYVGRRSGRLVRLPVIYRRPAPDVVRVLVGAPTHKSWWRNFTGDGAPVTLHLPEGTRHGTGVVRQERHGSAEVVAVEVTLAL